MQCLYENKPCDASTCSHAPEKYFTEEKRSDLCYSLRLWTDAAKKHNSCPVLDLSECRFRDRKVQLLDDSKAAPAKKKKVTQKDFLLAILPGREMTTEDLAKAYLDAGHGKKNASAGSTKSCFAVQLCNLKKAGHNIVRVSRGVYTIPQK